METKKPYISGLKGISCVLIMIGHFLGLYKYAEQFLPNISPLDAFIHSRISYILNEQYWLYLFFFLSGYLVAQSRVETVGDVVIKSVKRFFRFAFPIFFAYLVIYLIYILIGFHNANTIVLFQCEWFQNFYSEQYSFMQVLRSPIDVLFYGACSLNQPYWVLKEMLVASIIIYILKYCYLSLSKKNEALCFSALIIITFSFFSVSPVIFACLIGMLVSICENIPEILTKSYFAFWIMLIALFQYLLFQHFVFNIFFLFLIIFVPKVNFINNILSSKLFVFLGEISWGVYSFHWPLMCSLGALLIITLQPTVGLLYAFAIACVIVSIITLVISFIFNLTFERLSSYLSSRIDTHLKQIVSKLSTRKSK